MVMNTRQQRDFNKKNNNFKNIWHAEKSILPKLCNISVNICEPIHHT